MIWAILFACNGDKGDTALDTATADTGPIPNPLADVDWLEDQLVLNIQYGEGYDFYFGIIESTESCAQDTTYGCWTAENCGEEAWSSVNGSFTRGPYCHPAGDSGLALDYGDGDYERHQRKRICCKRPTNRISSSNSGRVIRV